MKTIKKILSILMFFSAAAPSMLLSSERSSTKDILPASIPPDGTLDLKIDTMHRDLDPLRNAIRRNDQESVERLIKDSSEVNGRDPHGNTPLMWATSQKDPNVTIIKLLLQCNTAKH